MMLALRFSVRRLTPVVTRATLSTHRPVLAVRWQSAAAASSDIVHEDFVSRAIQNMLDRTDHKLVTDEDLQAAVQAFQHQLEEARQCTLDCREAATDHEFATEYQTADGALQEAAAAYVDLLDLVQAASSQQHERLESVRDAASLLALRQELDRVKKARNL